MTGPGEIQGAVALLRGAHPVLVVSSDEFLFATGRIAVCPIGIGDGWGGHPLHEPLAGEGEDGRGAELGLRRGGRVSPEHIRGGGDGAYALMEELVVLDMEDGLLDVVGAAPRLDVEAVRCCVRSFF